MCPLQTTTVTPADCALAIGLPLSKSDFLADLNLQAPTYASKFRSSAPKLSGSWVWANHYESLARYILRVCDEVVKDGVTVIERATLPRLSEALQRHRVMTLVTHCEWPPITEIDVVDPSKLLESIRKGVGLVPAALRREMPTLEIAASLSSREELHRYLAAELGRIHETAYAWYASAADYVFSLNAQTDALPFHYLVRPNLEFTFDGLIRGGRAIELRDGFATMNEFVGTIPVTFSGILDLSLCNSAVFPKALKFARPDCLVAIARGVKHPDVMLARYRVIISELKRHPESYGACCARVHSAPAEHRKS